MVIDQSQSATTTTTTTLSNSHSDSIYALKRTEKNYSITYLQQLLDLAECLFYNFRFRQECCSEIDTVLLPAES